MPDLTAAQPGWTARYVAGGHEHTRPLIGWLALADGSGLHVVPVWADEHGRPVGPFNRPDVSTVEVLAPAA